MGLGHLHSLDMICAGTEASNPSRSTERVSPPASALLLHTLLSGRGSHVALARRSISDSACALRATLRACAFTDPWDSNRRSLTARAPLPRGCSALPDRDLKPENILLDEIGHVCLTDFGLSKEMVTTANAARTFCGTPEYLAPEILQGIGHGKAVDWWSLGTLVFEMLTGLPPFYSRNINHMYEKILKAELRCPTYLPPEVKSLIEGLLVRDPLRRVGSGPGDIKELEKAPFFSTISFNKVFNKEYTPIYKPNVGGETDVANFDPQFTQEAAIDSVVDASALAGSGNQFEGFTYEDTAAIGRR